MRLGVLSGPGSDWKESLEKVRIAEDLGYELVASGEAWGPSIIPWLSVLASQTSKIQIGSSILNTYSRTPAAIAQEFAMLEVLSGGRMVCGLGSSGVRVIEHFHGVEFSRPLRRIREYTEIFKLLMSGEKLHYDGEIFQMDRGFKLEYDRSRTKIPVYIAGITPRSVRQTGEVADGIIPIHWPKSRFGDLRDQMAEGAAKAGRSTDEITIAPFTNLYVLDGENDESRWADARQPLFHYINRMGDFYWQMLASTGFEAEVLASRAAWSERDSEGAHAAITEEMVREIQVIGSEAEVREELQARSELGAQLQMIQMPSGSVAEAGAKLDALIH
jgi:alkanesulfonate monooxygenase SsuD/methylene tetrahydromethanopterin reductase-like flavin-dependent oxidoreductase (luciferase family)